MSVLNRTKDLSLMCLLLLTATALSSCGTSRKVSRASGAPSGVIEKKDPAELRQVDKLLVFAEQFIGTRYRYGGNNPREGFDCSGFTCFVFNEFGAQLPRVSAEMAKEGRYV
ncbi:MAG TPA: NlpC/P60 family protein, partial [Anseongella sp.]|nr:NlpC/P60 family protein [Anseongella sp.]